MARSDDSRTGTVVRDGRMAAVDVDLAPGTSTGRVQVYEPRSPTHGRGACGHPLIANCKASVSRP